MKRCVYCGKEYPDDATVCSLDQQAVTSDGRPLRTPKPPRVDNRAILAARPMAVKLGVGVLAVTTVIHSARAFLAYPALPSHDPHFYSSAVFATVAPLAILYLVFRGKNWARWLVVCLLVLGTILPIPLHYRMNLSSYVWTVIDYVAAAALFERSSSEWFKTLKIAVKQSAPVAEIK